MKTRRSGIIAGLVIVGIIVMVSFAALGPGDRTEVIRPQVRDVTELLITSGQLQVRPSSDLAMNVSAVIDAIHVEEGQRVEQGEILLTLASDEAAPQAEQARAGLEAARRELRRLEAGTSDEEIAEGRAGLERAQSGLDLAEQEARRARMLFQDGVMTRADLDQAQAGLAQAQADVDAARARLERLEAGPRTQEVEVLRARVEEARAAVAIADERLERRTLTAPFDGTITRRFVDPGEAVSPGAPLLTLANMEGAEVFVETDENNVARIRRGQTARVIPLAFPEQDFDAEVFQIGPEVDPQRGVVAVRLRPREPVADGFFPEMTVDVNLMLASFEGALSVPRTAIFEEDDASYLYVVDDDRVRRVPVQVLARGDRWIAIEGVDDQALVVEDAARVSDGARVRIEIVSPEEPRS
jgi:multidrug resistance efflux pump